MRKHDKTRNKRQSQTLGELEKEAKTRLERIGLVMHIGFHYGNLEDNKQQYKENGTGELPEELSPQEQIRNPSYVEFKRDLCQKVVYGDCNTLMRSIFESLTHSVSGIMGIRYQQPFKGVFRAYPILYPQLDIESQREMHIEMLSELNTSLEAYLSRNPLRKIR